MSPYSLTSSLTVLREPCDLSVNLRRRTVATLLASLACLACGPTVSTANTGDTVLTTATNLSSGSSYTTTITPTSAPTTDVQFSGSYTGGTAFDINGAALNFGTLDDLDTTQSLVISNTNATAGSITLNTAANSTSGSISQDLLYVKAGANLTLQSGTGTLTLNTAVSGNFDNAGTLSIAAPLSLAAGTTLTFTGAGATSVTGGIAATTGAITLNSTGSLTLGGINAQTGNTVVNAGAFTLTGSLTGSGSSVSVSGGTFTESGTGVIGTGGGGLNVVGTTTATLSGLNTYTGTTTVSGGTLRLNFSLASAPATAANIINSGNTLALGGALRLLGGGSGAVNSQIFGTLSLSANVASTINVNANGGTLNVALGNLTRNTQGTLDINLPATGTVTTTLSQAPANGILVSATNVAFGTANGGTSWLTKATGSSPYALTAYTGYSTGTGNYLSTNNVDVTDGDAVSGATVNTLRFNAATDGLTLTGTNFVATGGILVTPTATSASISGGTLAGGSSGKELVVVDYGALNIGSVIANNASASALTLTGTGTTTISGANTFTGAVSINAGTVTLGSSQNGTTSGPLGTGSNVLSVGSGATLNLNGNNASVGSAAFNTGGGTTTLASTTAATLTVGGGNGGINLTGLSTITGAASLTINGSGSFSSSPAFTSTSTGALTFQNQGGAIYRVGLATNLGSSMSLVLNGGGSIQTIPTLALNASNNLVINGTGNQWNYQGVTTLPGAVTGSGALTLSNGFNPTFTFTGDLSGFHGSLTLLGSGSGQAFQFSNTTSFSSDANWTLTPYAGPTTASNYYTYMTYAGAGSKTITLGSLAGTTLAGTGAGAGYSSYGVLTNNTAGTTATWQIGGANANTSFAGVIQNGTGTSALTKAGTGSMTLSGVNTFTGATSITNGSLILAATNALGATSGITVGNGGTLSLAANNALKTPGATTSTTAGSPVSVTGQVPITLNGGTLLRNGSGMGLGSQSGTAGTVGAGSLTLTAASSLNFGTTGVGTLNFNGFADPGNYLLSITNYTHVMGGIGVDGTDDRLIFNQDMSIYLADFSINGQSVAEIALGNGEYEIVAVPEPATWAAGLLMFGTLGFRCRRGVGRLLHPGRTA